MNNSSSKNFNKKILIPIFLGAVVLCIALCAFLIFLSGSSGETKGEISIHSVQYEWIVSENESSLDDLLWIEAKDINIKSAEIYDNGNKIADAKNVNGRFEAVISVPVNKSDNHNVKVIADTKEKGKIESEEITLKVLDKFPVSYYDSEKNIDDEIASLFTDDYNNMSDDKKINHITEKLHKM